MKKFALGILLLCGTVTSVLAAQQQASVDRPAEPNFVFDDDGGKAQIVPADFFCGRPKNISRWPGSGLSPASQHFSGRKLG